MIIFPGGSRKEPPKIRQMTMGENDWDFDPMDDKWRLEGGECYIVKSVGSVT